MKSRYIVLEGLEGAGKTTAISTVIETLTQMGITTIDLIREPGGTPLAEKLRQLIKHGMAEEKITDKAELLMLYAARIQLMENVIKPTLAKKRWVIGDRNDLSSQAYQGGGRGFAPEFLKVLRHYILDNFSPDLTLYLDIEPALGLKRASYRDTLDLIEQQSLDFFHRTRQRYLELAAQDNTIITIDANQSLEQVQKNIRNVLWNWLTLTGPVE